MTKSFYRLISVGLTFLIVGCDNNFEFGANCICGKETLKGKVANASVISSGDRITSAKLIIDPDTGRLKITLAPILNPTTGLPYGADDTKRLFANAKLSTIKDSCDIPTSFGGNVASKADISFLLDTTDSMQKAIEGVSNSIDTFATSLQDANLDVHYSIVTFGDAYNTKKQVGSAYTVGTGADEPQTGPNGFDYYERPLLDFTTNLTLFRSFLSEIDDAFDNGPMGSGYTSENYYGVAVAMAGKARTPALAAPSPSPLTRRDDALFYEILVGDTCSHVEEYIDAAPGTDPGKWLPPSRNDLEALLGDGSVTIHSISIDPAGINPPCDPLQLTLDQISQVTGGVTLSVPESANGDVNLGLLGVDQYIKNFWLVDVDPSCVIQTPSFEMTLTLTVKDSDSAHRTQLFQFSVTTL